jgi:hypothetical protein
MINTKEIHVFAVKWLDKYKDKGSKDQDVEECFSEECFEIGFEMDCGNAFKSKFSTIDAMNDYEQLSQVISQVDDIFLLGSLIFSKWRGITHWSYMESLVSEKNRKWFIMTLTSVY